ncbi:uncharacterized protein BDZ83DRAFT_642777 [Colletotrichum acutatum]|uniref:Uncharacterized protein n=1 Tax=Glomerella acutata TaxID=27357 RepID=A0AAD8UA82_GLOAC|nr:uncharacterized protein BDZ83DRAFT_642777 [Colletotrichum acutatum]KAK1707732.1 hypothetical protein BDZ83DRAFT_642777 [Colletotrichum acutatum]
MRSCELLQITRTSCLWEGAWLSQTSLRPMATMLYHMIHGVCILRCQIKGSFVVDSTG